MKMTDMDHRATVSRIVEQAFGKSGRVFFRLKELIKAIPANDRKQLGVTLSADQAKIRAALGELPERFRFHRYSGAVYLLNGPVRDVLADQARLTPGRTFKRMNAYFPLKTEELRTHLNALADEGRVRIKISAGQNPAIFPAAGTGAKAEPGPDRSEPPADDGTSLIRRVKQAYDAVGRGGNYVYIFKIRQHLGWSRDEFDRTLRRMIIEGYVAAHPGNPGALTSEQVYDSYRDELGDLYLTVSWRKEI
jgi:hypothetical protein